MTSRDRRRSLLDDELAVTAVEYALIVALITLTSLVALKQLGVEMGLVFDVIAKTLGS